MTFLTSIQQKHHPMKLLVYLLVFALFFLPSVIADTDTNVGSGRNATESWNTLVANNARFVTGGAIINQTVQERGSLASGQAPMAVVVTCSDSRVAPEILFQTDLGDLFVIRVAGNVVSYEELGSIEYAVQHLNTSLVILLGHSSCGACAAAISMSKQGLTFNSPAIGSENIPVLVNSILPAAADAINIGKAQGYSADSPQVLDMAVSINAKRSCDTVLTNSKLIRGLQQSQPRFKLIYAQYFLSNGSVIPYNQPCGVDASTKFLLPQFIEEQQIIQAEEGSMRAIHEREETAIGLGIATAALLIALVVAGFWIVSLRTKLGSSQFHELAVYPAKVQVTEDSIQPNQKLEELVVEPQNLQGNDGRDADDIIVQ